MPDEAREQLAKIWPKRFAPRPTTPLHDHAALVELFAAAIEEEREAALVEELEAAGHARADLDRAYLEARELVKPKMAREDIEPHEPDREAVEDEPAPEDEPTAPDRARPLSYRLAWGAAPEPPHPLARPPPW